MGHTKHKDGLPSVTEVLGIVDKPFLRFWYGKHGTTKCNLIKREAGELGQRVHDAIESLLQGQAVTLEGREGQMLELFKDWQKITSYQAIEIERKVESKQHLYHGTLDSIGKFSDSDELVILDWKTSSQIDDLYGCQLAAYAQAYFEETGKLITKGMVVRIDKKEDAKKPLEVKTFENLPAYFLIFQDCLRIWKFVNKKELPSV